MNRNDRQLVERLDELNMDRGRRPLWAPPNIPRTYRLSIIGGNALTSLQNGIKHVDNVQTEVPADYDPDVTTSYANGWGNAYLLINGITQVGKVLVCADQIGGVDTLIEGWQISSAGFVYMPVAGAPTNLKAVYRGLAW